LKRWPVLDKKIQPGLYVKRENKHRLNEEDSEEGGEGLPSGFPIQHKKEAEMDPNREGRGVPSTLRGEKELKMHGGSLRGQRPSGRGEMS